MKPNFNKAHLSLFVFTLKSIVLTASLNAERKDVNDVNLFLHSCFQTFFFFVQQPSYINKCKIQLKTLNGSEIDQK